MKEAKKSVASKTDVDNALDLGDKIEKKKRILTFDSSYFFGKSHFEDDKGWQFFFLIFQPVY